MCRRTVRCVRGGQARLPALAGAGSTLPLNGIAAGTTNIQSFAETAFQLRITPTILPQWLGAAVLGALGGIAPAWRAARQPAPLSLRA
jgi:hypothetical protein